MALEWREQLSVGNDLIDSDHKYLIEIINQAAQSLKAKDRRGVMTALDNLSQYSQTHFSREEKIASAVGYTQLSPLHLAHEDLLVKLDQVKLEIYEKWNDVSAEHFSLLLRDWLINHVIKEDMLMKPLLKKHSPRFDPR